MHILWHKRHQLAEVSEELRAELLLTAEKLDAFVTLLRTELDNYEEEVAPRDQPR